MVPQTNVDYRTAAIKQWRWLEALASDGTLEAHHQKLTACPHGARREYFKGVHGSRTCQAAAENHRLVFWVEMISRDHLRMLRLRDRIIAILWDYRRFCEEQDRRDEEFMREFNRKHPIKCKSPKLKPLRST